MILCVDTSAMLHLVLDESEALMEITKAEALISSEFLAVESLRTIDRLRLRGSLST